MFQLYLKIEKNLNITKSGQLKKHLGVNYSWKEDTDNAKVAVNDFVTFTEHKVKTARTPGFAVKTLKNHTRNPVEIKAYRSLAGQLMYYSVKFELDIVNTARDLARHISNPGINH